VLRVGGLQSRPIDVRYVSATNRDLGAAVARGLFRQDLFFRLNGISLSIPPLRERAGEIEELARVFIARACREGGGGIELTPEARELLQRHSWPGNIRELRNVIERAVLLCAEGRIRPEDLSIATTSKALDGAEVLRQELDALERRRIVAALDECAGSQTKAARLLGISRGTLIARIEAFGLPRPRKPTSNDSSRPLNNSRKRARPRGEDDQPRQPGDPGRGPPP
jgi:DNA-binding NtrC family response regulator